jgi:peptidoglycan/LPS O-acetylase OafA/YrhL
MVHAPLIFVALSTIDVVETWLGAAMTVAHPNGSGHRLFGLTQWLGDAGMLGMLTVVLAVSALTYAMIEKPGREWGARASQRLKSDGWAAVFGARPHNAAQRAAD